MTLRPPPSRIHGPRPAAPSVTAHPSLWRDLADGSAGWGVRLGVTFAMAVALTGVVPLLTYFIAALVPPLNRGGSMRGGVYPVDELLAFVLILAAGAFLVGTAWLWSRRGWRRTALSPAVLTVGIAVATVTLCIAAGGGLRGDEELVVTGVIFLGAAATILVWVQAYRRRGPRFRSLTNEQDGLPDILCPACGYRMVGLTEARCPECGAAYTIDELVAKQNFGPPPAAAPPEGTPATPIMRSA